MSTSEVEAPAQRRLCASAPCFHPRNPEIVKKCPAVAAGGSGASSAISSQVSSPTTRGPASSAHDTSASFPFRGGEHATAPLDPSRPRDVTSSDGRAIPQPLLPPPPPPPPLPPSAGQQRRSPFQPHHHHHPHVPSWVPSSRQQILLSTTTTAAATPTVSSSSSPPSKRSSLVTSPTTSNTATTATTTSFSSLLSPEGGAGPSPTSGGGCYPRTYEGLGLEIQDLLQYASLNADEQRARRDFVDVIRAVAKGLWSECRVVPFGSFALGLSTPKSDVDVAVLFPSSSSSLAEEQLGAACESDEEKGADAATTTTTTTMTPSDPTSRLRLLSDAFGRIGLSVSVIDQCRVPVIQVLQPWSGLRCDISVTLEHPELVVAHQLGWLESEPHARTLIMMTKLALQQWGLNCLFTGGISSTCVYSLVHRFLMESREPAVDEEEVQLMMGGEGASEAWIAATAESEGSRPCSLVPSGLPSRIHSPPSTSSPSPSSKAAVIASATSASAHSVKTIRSHRNVATHGDDAVEATTSNDEDEEEDGGCSMSPCETSDMERDFFLSSPAASPLPSPTPATSLPPQSSSTLPKKSEATMAAELLLQFWRYCASDFFQGGYLIDDAFRMTEPSPTQDSTSALKVRFGADLSKGSFRLGEVQFLFQHSAEVMSRIVRPADAVLPLRDHWLTRGALPVTTLSSVFADPRCCNNNDRTTSGMMIALPTSHTTAAASGPHSIHTSAGPHPPRSNAAVGSTKNPSLHGKRHQQPQRGGTTTTASALSLPSPSQQKIVTGRSGDGAAPNSKTDAAVKSQYRSGTAAPTTTTSTSHPHNSHNSNNSSSKAVVPTKGGSRNQGKRNRAPVLTH